MNNDFNNGGQNNQQQGGQPPQDFGRSQEAKGAFENGQTSWSNPGTPWSNVPPSPNDPNANSAQTLGIVGLIVSIVCCALAGLIMGIIACSKAKTSRMTLGYEAPEARTGRICGIIAIVMAALRMVGSVIYAILAWALNFSGMLEQIYEKLPAAFMLFH